MWFLSEISIKTGIDEKIIDNICASKGIEVNYYFGSDDKYLGKGITDTGYELLQKELTIKN